MNTKSLHLRKVSKVFELLETVSKMVYLKESGEEKLICSMGTEIYSARQKKCTFI